MKRMSWFDGHLSEEKMIGLLDGELGARAAKTSERHLKSCWTCRHQCEQLRLAMNHFIEVRETLMASASAQPPRGWGDFDGRLLRAEANTLGLKPSAPALRFGRPLFAPAVIGVSLGLLIWLLHVGPLSAKEVLERSSASEAAALTRAGRAVIVQDLKIEYRHRVARVSVWRAPSIKRSKSFWDERGDAGLKNDLERVYRRAGLEWTEPLSASNHSRWEASLAHHSEAVQTDNATLRVITHNDDHPGADEIVEAELIVRTADWSPVEERFKLNDGQAEEYRVTQTGYRVESSSAELARMYEILSPMNLEETKATPRPAVAGLPRRGSGGAEVLVDLPDSEVEALSLLHLIKADRLEAATVSRTKTQIVVEAYVAEDDRRRLIERMLSPVKSVNLIFHSLSQTQDSTHDLTQGVIQDSTKEAPYVKPEVISQDPSSSRNPVLFKPLVEQVGSMEIASDLVSRRLESLTELGVQLRALERLSTRFPAEVRNGLSPEASHRLDQLAMDYVDAARRAWREWEMSEGSFQTVLGVDKRVADDSSPKLVCGAWQDERRIALVASRLQDLFSQGFTSTSGGSLSDSGDLTADSISTGIHQLSAVLTQVLSPECLH
jgi:hypothetical protein